MGIALAVACLPPIALLGYVWYLDRMEHEPFSLVLKVFLFSALLGTFAAALIESVGDIILEITFIKYLPLIGGLVEYFVVVALTEEFCKRLPVMLFVWKNKEFDHRFDAIVYCVTAAIGFAVAENITYVLMYGADVALARLIPVHTICGVVMGYYLACAKQSEVVGNTQVCKRCRNLSIAVPVLIHGFWDWALSSGFDLLALVAMAGIVVLSIVWWRRLHALAAADAPFWHFGRQ